MNQSHRIDLFCTYFGQTIVLKLIDDKFICIEMKKMLTKLICIQSRCDTNDICPATVSKIESHTTTAVTAQCCIAQLRRGTMTHAKVVHK